MRRSLLAILPLVILTWLTILLFNNVVSAQTDLTLTPITWDVVGLDSNRPTEGPQYFPVGVNVRNDGATTLTNVTVNFNWDDTNPNIDLRPGTQSSITFDSLAPGADVDAYFEIAVDQTAAAYDETRAYFITATADGIGTEETPRPRQLYVEYLISQNRNATLDMLYAPEGSSLTSVPAGGAMNLVVGETYNIQLVSSTATQGYEQLESFLTLPNTIFQINSVETTYSAITSPHVSNPHPRLYADACLWDPDPNSPTYLSCLESTQKAGGNLTTTYNVTIIDGGGQTASLNSLIYDFSGSSFHYNSDYSSSARIANIIDPTIADISKRFIPDLISADGTSTLRFTITNPNPVEVSGYQFVDDLPGNMIVANPANASSTCGGTVTAAPGSGSLSFDNGTISANSSCIVLVDVSVPFDGGQTYPVQLDNTVDLYVGDSSTPSATGSASLEVSEEPPPPLECTTLPTEPVAEWQTFDSANDPNHPPTGPVSDNKGIGTAAGAGLTTTVSSNRWAASDVPSDENSPDPIGDARANARYFEFIVNTEGLDEVSLTFQASRQNANGPAAITLDYGPAGSAQQVAQTWGPISTQANSPSTLSVSGLTNLSATGNTTFRFYVHGASNPNIEIRIHNMVISSSGTVCSPVDPSEAPLPPEISKSFWSATARIGETARLIFTITNPNTDDTLTDITFRDVLPDGMEVDVPALYINHCSSGSLWSIDGDDTGVLVFTNGELAPGESCTLEVYVVSNTAGPNVNITDPVDATETLAGNSASATLDVLPPPLPPTIGKQFDPNPLLNPSSTSTLTFTITNADADDALQSVAFTDSLPAGMTVASVPGVNNTCGGTVTANSGSGTISLTGGNIPVAGSCTINVDVSVNADVSGGPATYDNLTSTVSHIFNGTTYEGDTADATLVVDNPVPSLTLSKQIGLTNDAVNGDWFSYIEVAPGSDVYYRFIIENTGEVALDNIAINDLDVDTSACSVASLPVASDNPDDTSHISTCVVGPVQAQAAGNVNTAQATSTQATSEPDSATYATTGLSIVKSANPQTFTAAGETINYTFTVENIGSVALDGPVTIVDDLTTDESCPALTTVGNGDSIFDPGEIIECTATYQITSDDITAGEVTNTAYASADGVDSPTDSVTVTALVPPTANDDSSTGNTPGDPAIVDALDNDTPGSAPLDPATVQISGTTNPGDPLVVPGEGTWSVNTATGEITFTPDGGFTGDPTPITYTVDNEDGLTSNAATVTVTYLLADLAVIKTVDNPTPSVGDTVIFTITVLNYGPSDATGVAVTDTLPNGYTYVSDNGGGAYDDTSGVWTVGTLTNGASVSLEISATVNASGDYNNIATITASDQNDPDPSNDSDSASTTPAASADLAVTKTVDNTTPSVGDTVTFTITVTNNGPSDATGIEITDALPDGYTYDSDNGGGDYVSGTGIWTVGALTSGASASLEISATVNASGDYNNIATITASDQNDPDPASDSDSAATTPAASADLAVIKTVNNATPDEGDTIVYTITVENLSSDTDATGVIVTDQLPSGVTYVSDDSGGDYNAATGEWNVGTLNAGDSLTLNITATVDPGMSGSQITNTASISNVNETDPNPNNDSDSASTTPAASADLAVIKTVDNPTPSVGDTVTFTITVLNYGPSDATGVAVTDTLPNGYTYVSDNGGGAYDAGTGVWTVGALTNGASVSLEISATVNASGDYNNVATITASDQNDPDPASDSDSASTTPAASADLAVIKTVDNPTPSVGDTVIFTITVLNYGPGNATGVVVTDTLPVGISYVSDDSGGDYSSATGEWNVGTLNAGDTLTLNITATVDPGMSGAQFINTASISDVNETDPNPDNDSDSAVVNVGTFSDLQISKANDTSDTANVDDSFNWTLTIGNTGTEDVTFTDGDTILTDDLPDTGLTYGTVSVNNATDVTGDTSIDCGITDATLTCVANGGDVTLTAATGQFDVVIPVTVDADGSYTNPPDPDGICAVDPDNVIEEANEDDNTCAPNTVTVNAPDVSATKSASLFDDVNSNGLVDEGDTLRYEVVIVNNGTQDASDIAFNDTPDTNTTLDNTSVTATQGTITAGNNPGDSSITVEVGTLSAGGGSVMITYDVTINSNLPADVTFVENTGLVSGSNIDDTPTDDPTTPDEEDDPTRTEINQPIPPTPTPTNTPDAPVDQPEPSRSTPQPVITVFDPAISKIGFLEPGELGVQRERLRWFFTVTNVGDAPGVNIVVTDEIRPELRIDELNIEPPLAGNVSGQTVTVTIPSLAPGESVDFSLLTTVIEGGADIDNTACLTADNLDTQRCTTAQAISTLPSTGESPWWRKWLPKFK